MFERNDRYGLEYIFVREIKFNAKVNRKQRIRFDKASQTAKFFSKASALDKRRPFTSRIRSEFRSN